METRSRWSDGPPRWGGQPPRGRRERLSSEERWERWERRNQSDLTLFLPLLVAAIQVTGCLIASRTQLTSAPLDGLAYALLVAGPLALAWRRSHPLLAQGLALLATVTYMVLDYPWGPFFLAALIAFFGAVRRGHRVGAWILTGIGYLLFVLSTVGEGTLVIGGHAFAQPTLGQYVVVAAWTAVAIAIAEVSRSRAQHFAEIARTRAEAARARQEQARRQASDERLRIAQELHDELGHHLSLISVRAGVALHLLDTQPEQAREALSAIKLASSEALREVRTVLGTLSSGDEAPPRSPAPGLAGLERLAKDTQDAGLTVHIEQTGTVRPVPGEVDRASYRIVQEAMTNVRRHAGPNAAVTVLIGYGASELTLRIDDTGVGIAPSTSDTPSDTWEGNGIPGMRERAVALGGTLTAGARPGGGFRVEAVLPLRSFTYSEGSPTSDGAT